MGVSKAKPAYSIPDFTRFCGSLTLDSGKKFKLETFQRTLLRDYFHGATETVVIVPKKNGKTTLLSALALYHLRKTPQAECVIAASSRDQAKILFNQAAKMVRASGLEGEFDIKSGYREIRYKGDENWVMRVLAADADTADGVIPTLALVDELHRHKSAELYGVFTDGLGPRDGQIITISTAGSDPESPLGVMRDQAYEHGVDRIGPYRKAVSPDGSFVLHEWALDESDDLDDMELVAEANPASWQTPATLRRRRNSPSMTPWRWKRFACGIWTDVEEPWVDEAEWDACKGTVELDRAAHWTMGVDIGQVFDSSGVVTVGLVAGRLHVQARIWDPQPGKPITIGEVEAYVVAQAETGRVRQIGYDPMRFNRSAEVLEERGLEMIEFPQTHARMVPASNTLYDLVREGKIVHDGDLGLKRHVMSGVAAETDAGWRISKKKSRGKIDALIALALAVDLAWRVEEPKESEYDRLLREGYFAAA
jgi:phage terminase large subunit-like protein